MQAFPNFQNVAQRFKNPDLHNLSNISKKPKGTIKLYVKAKKGGRIGETMEFKIYNLPNATASIDGKYNGAFETSKGKVGRFLRLSAKKDPSFVYDLDYRVVEFSVLYTDARGNARSVGPFKGNKFSKFPEVKSNLESVKTGKTITFFDIKTRVYQKGNPIKLKKAPKAGIISVTVK